MPVDVSVIVPFFNPGANIEDCLKSLIDQTLPRDRFDVVLVDDGSTDGSYERVAQWVQRHPDLMTLHRIPASGGPGRPRNVAMDRSDGRYIQFLDSDDTLSPRALERMLEVADSSAADVVVGKLSSDFHGIHQPMFRRTVTGRSLEDFPLMRNLTVCKMFRRDFMSAHDVRFLDGPHYIEDQHFCVQSFARATSVAIVGDTPCYLYRRRRTGGRHLSDTVVVPLDYYRELADVLDLVDTEISTPRARIEAQSRFYRNEMLGRLRGRAMLSYDPDYRRELVSQVRELATTRIAPQVHDNLPMLHRAQSRLLLDDDLDGLTEFARQLRKIRLLATTTTPTWRDGRLSLEVDAAWWLGGEPFRLDRDRDGWLLPQSMAPGVRAEDRRLHEGDEPDLDLAVLSRADSSVWSTTEGLTLKIESDGCPRVGGAVTIDPTTVMGGAALTPGVWNLRLRVIFGGMSRAAPLRPALNTAPTASAWLANSGPKIGSVIAYWAGASPSLSLDVDEWSRSLTDLLVDQPLTLPRIDRHHHLVLDAAALRGPRGARGGATVILEPLDSPELGLEYCSAELVIGPTGSALHATLPSVPKGSGRWAPWLRIGEIGGAPARRLPVELSRGRGGRLRARSRD